MERTVDQFTTEVISGALDSIGQEMFEAMRRSSMSPVIYETLDYGIGLIDADGRLVAQGNGVTVFVGCISSSVRSIIEAFGNDIHEGDAFLLNDPFTGGGTHPSDVMVAVPIFVEGRLRMFSACKAHWTDVGGMAPGSWTTDSTEIYQEGLRLPALKLEDRGVRSRTVVDLLRANIRMPERSFGDMHAQLAAVRVGERRVVELYQRYGSDAVDAAISWTYDYTERMAALELGRLPHGVFEATDAIDADGRGGGPFEIRVKVTIDADRFTCDFTGSAPQTPGPINCTYAGLSSGVQAFFKGLTSPDLPSNDGTFRAVEVICPPGTVFTAELPAPVSAYWESLLFATELLWKALAPHMPDRLTAGTLVTVCGTILSGQNDDGSGMYVMVEPQLGGWGARDDADGISGFFALPDAATQVVPIEVSEARHGVRVRRFGFDATPTAGAGRFRGGRGCVREYEIMTDKAQLTVMLGRHTSVPWGVDGGHDGSPNSIEVRRVDGSVERHGYCSRLPLVRGDRVTMVTATGGGWGDPLERDVERVRDDIRDGLVSLTEAESDYGITLAGDDLAVVALAPNRPKEQHDVA